MPTTTSLTPESITAFASQVVYLYDLANSQPDDGETPILVSIADDIDMFTHLSAMNKLLETADRSLTCFLVNNDRVVELAVASTTLMNADIKTEAMQTLIDLKLEDLGNDG